MPTLKRAREASTEATDTTPTKRARLGPLELQLLDKDTLIKRILGLQDDIDTLSASAKNSPAAAGLSEKQIYEKVLHVRKLMVKGIKSQMKVTCPPSCRLFQCSVVDETRADNRSVETQLQNRDRESQLQRYGGA